MLLIPIIFDDLATRSLSMSTYIHPGGPYSLLSNSVGIGGNKGFDTRHAMSSLSQALAQEGS